MAEYHDPLRQAASLSEVCAQDKRPIGLFLAAGCPYAIHVAGSPLLPDIAGLTAAVYETSTDAAKELSRRATDALNADGVTVPNIENILTFIRSLRQVAGPGTTVRSFSSADLETLDAAISAAIAEIVNVTLPEPTTAFDQLVKWGRAIIRTFPIEFFTTNYDLLIEQALERWRVPFFDGFVGVKDAFFDQRAIDDDVLPSRWARIWKLHGSINWELNSAGDAVRRASTIDPMKSRLIHPSHLKYTESRRMPYLAMSDRLRAFLKQSSAVLVICGYSFRDDHLNEVLSQGVQANPTAVIFALQYGTMADQVGAAALAEISPNLNVFARDEAIIGSDRAPWKARHSTFVTESRLMDVWAPDVTATEDLRPGSFMLGDFNQFGRFMESFVTRAER